MDISKYTSYFHDGIVIDIRNINNDIEIWMESSQIQPEWNLDPISLSDFETIKGKLHLKNIKSILINAQPVKQLKIIYDDCEIFNFSIKRNNIKLFVRWNNFSPKAKNEKFEEIIITADQVSWENDPELFDGMAVDVD